ncbi:MAG: glycosyltransferase family 4 protein, partial [Schleiferiaceae bacterium]|nr:glycosyltransferase family 4 protein [Schleiferiaceae bacterium]
ISAEDGKFFSQFGKRQLSMPCALEMSNYPDFPSTKNNFFHFGAMDWMPNVNGVKWLIKEVWPKVVSEIEEAKLVIAGKNMPEDLLGINDKGVEVVGEVDDSSEFYEDNGIMLVPLLSGSGIRIKIIEGLGYGKTIVSTKIGSEGIPVESKKEIVIADDAEAFAQAMIELYSNLESRLKIGKQARLFAQENYGTDKLSVELLNFYNSI